MRLLSDFDLAEEAMHDAFSAALDTWPRAGIPDKPRPWLSSTCGRMLVEPAAHFACPAPNHFSANMKKEQER